ncbi:hypothetical protein BDC45DRAFT_6060 [Circinella umbellata]|nr:hypothetical protein BDC45DRAFT_6060 [Circinella umbellata]
MKTTPSCYVVQCYYQSLSLGGLISVTITTTKNDKERTKLFFENSQQKYHETSSLSLSRGNTNYIMKRNNYLLLCNQPIASGLGIIFPQARRVWNSSNNCLCIRIRTVPFSSSRQKPPTNLTSTVMADAESEEARRAKVLAARKKLKKFQSKKHVPEEEIPQLTTPPPK